MKTVLPWVFAFLVFSIGSFVIMWVLVSFVMWEVLGPGHVLFRVLVLLALLVAVASALCAWATGQHERTYRGGKFR